MFAILYCFYKSSFWGAGVHIRPNCSFYPKGFLANFLNLPAHLQEKNFGKDFEGW